MLGEVVPLQPHGVIPPSLEPLRESAETATLDADLKALFIMLYETTLRAKEREINVYGAPHLGSFATIERSVKSDALALQRGANSEPYMRELFRAWKSRNPRRGTSFLEFYLQMLWPNSWEVNQLWQDKASIYPTALFTTERPNTFLTSRLRATIETDDPTGADIVRAAPALRSVLPARLLLRMAMLRRYANEGASALKFANGVGMMDVGNFHGIVILSPYTDGFSFANGYIPGDLLTAVGAFYVPPGYPPPPSSTPPLGSFLIIDLTENVNSAASISYNIDMSGGF